MLHLFLSNFEWRIAVERNWKSWVLEREDGDANELWQIINTYYRFIVDYPEEYYKTKGLHEFTKTTIDNCAIIKHNIQNTLLHDEAWAFINIGMRA